MALVLLLALLLLAAFPWGLMRGPAAALLSRQFGRPVTIGALERLDHLSFSPVLQLRDVRVPQADWAGKGDLILLREARIELPVFPLLIGRVRPEAVDIAGLRLDLVRDAKGRESWRREMKRDGGNSGHPSISRLTISDGQISYRDAKRDRSFAAWFAADANSFRADGNGMVQGAPVDVRLRGAAIDRAGPWPFIAEVEGPAVGIRLAGRMEAPLDTGHFTGRAVAHADDLKRLDAIIEAGLPATQPVKLAAAVEHDGPDWKVRDLKGVVGRSDVAGDAAIRKRDGRHIIDARLNAGRFDFDDLSSNRGRAIAAAKRAKFGRRLFPDTAIDLDNVRRTDGRLTIAVRELLWPGPSPFAGLAGTLVVDHGRLTIEPLTLRLRHGSMAGKVVVDQRNGAPAPTLTLDLAARNARLIDFIPDAGIDGPLRGHIRLVGPGRTVRAAVGRSSGSVALVAQDGLLPARTASLLGQDLGKGLFGGKDEQARLRCLIVRLDANRGHATAAPVLIDTSRAQTRATGSIDMASEAMNFALNGVAKQGSALRLKGSVQVTGTIKEPQIVLPEKAGTLGGILKMIGRALGDKPPSAPDADCDALAARALR